MTVSVFRYRLKSDLGQKIYFWAKYRDFTVFWSTDYTVSRVTVQWVDPKNGKIAIFRSKINLLTQIRFYKISKYTNGHFKTNFKLFWLFLKEL